MNRSIRSAAAPLALSTLACLVLTGCHVSDHKNGNNDNVDIGTPFGSMQVKTNSNTDTSAIGIAAYPGAVPIKDNDKDSNSADINMSFGSFHLGVKAAGFQTPDNQDKVIAFYRNDLARYGDVIECANDTPIGQPTRTSQGLSCDTKHGAHLSTGDHGVELRTGSELHQHVVDIETHDGGTKIGLIALDLPSHLSNHDKNDSE
jgi:hypothetical protein